MVPETEVKATGSITIGNGICEKTAMYGDISGTVYDKNGSTVGRAKLSHVACSPGMKFNLCLLCQYGWEMKGKKELLLMERNNQEIKFDIKVTTATGVVYCVYLKLNAEIASAAVEYNTNQAHEPLGHSHEDATRVTSISLRIKLIRGGKKPCQACIVAESKQKNMTKVSEHVKSDNPGERMFLDLASFKPPRKGMVMHKPNWRLMVDESTNFKITDFYKKKNGMDG
jgi:hypothetical protein